MNLAGVSTAIKINDQMSPALRSMNKALQIVLNSFEAMQDVTKDPINTAAISEARSELASVSTTLDKVERGIRDAQNEQEGFTKEAVETGNALSGLTGKIMSAVAAYATLQTVQQGLELSDRVSNTTARLSMIVDDGGSVAELEQKIFASAQRSRANYMDMADSIAKLSLNAPDAFKSNNETIQFAENLNKLFAIAGTETAAIESATLQLTQALGSGVLRGEEFNAVFEAAPNIMQEVAEYMGVPIGQLRSMAAEGQISAEVVKNALLGATDDINSQFERMPTTWAQVWNKFKNHATVALRPVLDRLSEIASSERFHAFVENVGQAMGVLADMLIYAFDLIGQMGSFAYDNWSAIEPVLGTIITLLGIYATALAIAKGAEIASAIATGALTTAKLIGAAAMMLFTGSTWAAASAQMGLNAAMYACPLVWIIALVLALIALIIGLMYAAVAAWNKITGSTLSATGMIIGNIASVGAFIWNMIVALLDLVLGFISACYNTSIRFANFLANLFKDPIASIIHLFGDLADGVLAILETIASAIDKVFGSNLADAVSGWRGSLDAKIEAAVSEYGNGSYEQVYEEKSFSAESLGLDRIAYGDANKYGYSIGKGIEDSISNFSLDSILNPDLSGAGMDLSGYGLNVPDYDELTGNVADIADNTGGIKDAVDITEEDLKYLRDVAEMETINRFTTAEISVDMGGVNNNISSEMDIDGFMDTLTDKLYESMTIAAEGVHE